MTAGPLSLPIRLLFAGLVLGLTTLLVGLSLVSALGEAERKAWRTAQTTASSEVARLTAITESSGSNRSLMAEMLVTTGADLDLNWALVVDPDGQVLASTRSAQRARPLVEAHADLQPWFESLRTRNPAQAATQQLGDTLVVGQPALWPAADGEARGKRVGAVFVAVDVKRAAGVLREDTLREHAIEALVLSVGLGGLLTALERWMVRPLLALRQAAEAAGRGDLTQRVHASGVRELDQLAFAFNTMNAQLAATLNSLKESEGRFRALTDSAPDAIILMRPDGVIEQFNGAAEEVFGWTAEQIRGQPLSVLMEPEAAARHQGHVDQYALMEGSASRTMLPGRLVRAQRRDGSLLTLEVGISKHMVGGELRLTAMARDVSDRVRAQAELAEHRQQLEAQVLQRTSELAEERDRAQAATLAKNEFLANVSHEVRTPMNAIIGLAHLARRQAQGAQAAHLDRLSEVAAHLSEVFNDIVDFSRIESGRLSLLERDCEIARPVQQVADQLAERARLKGLGFHRHIEPAVPTWVRVDEMRLQQLLLQLAGNAIKFTDSGRVSIQVRHMGERDGRVRLRFEVTDSGIGIEAETLQRLGRPFQQADQSDTKFFAGTGLGLAICHRLLGLMGSSLEVDSHPGTGSTFWFDLELAIVTVAAAAPPPSPDWKQATPDERTLSAVELQALRSDARAAAPTGELAAAADPRPGPPASPWHSVAGLHADVGLQRTRGNAEVYRRLLERFVESHGEDPQVLRSLALPQAHEQAYALAHTLKSSAGTIGAWQVAEAAQGVPAVRADHASAMPALAQAVDLLAERVDALLQGLRSVLQSIPRPTAAPTLAVAPAQAGELREAIGRRDLSALRFTRENEAAILQLLGEGPGSTVLAAVQGFEFDTALRLLDERLGATTTTPP